MNQRENQKVIQGEKTKQELVNFARGKFAEQGFTHTRFDEIAKQKGLTQGALYHHFKNKKDLFEQVYIQCAKEVSKKVGESSDHAKNWIDGIIRGSITFIKEVISDQNRRIMLEDAISVLGWKRWKEIDDQSSESGLLDAISQAQKEGSIDPSLPSKAIARMISGGINELGLWVAESEDPQKNFHEAQMAISRTIKALQAK
jgi:AcrR family transcriptional regulator